MRQTFTEPKTVLILYTETGGTHRNTAEAVREAIMLECPDGFRVECVDIWKLSPIPFRWLPRMVHLLRERKNMRRFSVQNTQNPRWKRIFNKLSRPYLRRMMSQLMIRHPNQLMVALHPLVSAPIIDAMDGQSQQPFVVVVTDLATKNAFWFDDRIAMTFVPTEQCRKNAMKNGVPWEKLRMVGVPVSMRYAAISETQVALRSRLGLSINAPVVLLAGGKTGSGPLRSTAVMIDEAMEGIQLVVVTGTNIRLKQQLERGSWKNRVIVLGYVDHLWDWMWAADILVSKAGTGMLAEALSVGLPMILFHRIPYLEDENVTYLVNEGAAVWAPTPSMVVNGLRRWLESKTEREAAVAACRRLSEPKAARLLAQELIQLAEE
jgi:1,2-diacylglycerol 3-beta-galactosyltransferase